MTLRTHLQHNLVAYLALFVALGGTSFAAVAVTLPPNSVGTAQIQPGAITASKIRAGVIPAGYNGPSFYFGSWNANGTVAIYEPDVAMLKRGTGFYKATFFTDVSGCGQYATITGTTTGQIAVGPSTLDQVTSHGGLHGTLSLDVRTFDATGAPADRSFAVAAICGIGKSLPPGGVIGAAPAAPAGGGAG
jgi:hypothetical protein